MSTPKEDRVVGQIGERESGWALFVLLPNIRDIPCRRAGLSINSLIRRVMLLFAVIVLLACAPSVSAADLSFSYGGPGVTARGTFVTTDPVLGEVCPFGCSVTAISLESLRNGQSMTLIPSGRVNDNFLENLGADGFGPDGFGIGFASGGTNYLLQVGSQGVQECLFTGSSCILLTCFVIADAGGATCGSDVVKPLDATTGTTPVTLTFPAVTQGGITTLATGTTGPTPPDGFTLGDPLTYFNLTTTAVFSGAVAICIDYSGITFTDESHLKLLHFDGSAWVDITTSLDTTANSICGSVTSLSPFIIAQPTVTPPPATIIVPIDIKPGPTNVNCIQLTNNGTIPVAILGGAISVGNINRSSLEIDDDSDFSTIGVSPTRTALQDVNGDGKLDLVLQFSTKSLNAAGMLRDDIDLFITGTLNDGTKILGADHIFLAGGPHCQ